MPSSSRSLARAFRHRNYRLFFGGQLISLIGTWMQSVAQSWLVYRLTGSEMLLGLVSFSNQLPVFLLASFGGAVADRHDRRRILLVTQTCAMVLASVLAALTLTSHVQVTHVFVLAALLGTVNAFDIPARSAFVADMVGREDLMNAVALNSSMMTLARIVGPAVAGAAVAAVGEGWCFFGNAVSFLAVIASLAAIHGIRREASPVPGSTLAQVVEGFQFAFRSPPVAALLLLLGVVSLMGMPYVVLMPVIADRTLHIGAGGLGSLMASSGAGALAAALLLAARKSMQGLGSWVIGSAGGFGVSLVLFALAKNPHLAMLALVPVGFFMMVQMSASSTLVQAMTPDALRGRVMSLYSMMFIGMAPFGALLAGALSAQLGPTNTVALGGIVCVGAAAVFGTRLPRLRHVARSMIVELRPTAGAPPEENAAAAVRG